MIQEESEGRVIGMQMHYVDVNVLNVVMIYAIVASL